MNSSNPLSSIDWREVGNAALHITVGASLAALICWNDWFIVLATFVYAWLREQAQHRYVLTAGAIDLSEKVGYELYRVQKRSFWDFSWVTPWRMFEVAQWTAGAAVAVAVWHVFQR